MQYIFTVSEQCITAMPKTNEICFMQKQLLSILTIALIVHTHILIKRLMHQFLTNCPQIQLSNAKYIRPKQI